MDRLDKLARRIAAGDVAAAHKALEILAREKWSPSMRPLTRSEALGLLSPEGRIVVIVEVEQGQTLDDIGKRVLDAAFEPNVLAFNIRHRVLATIGETLLIEVDAGVVRDEPPGEIKGFRVVGRIEANFVHIVHADSEDAAVQHVLEQVAPEYLDQVDFDDRINVDDISECP